MMLFQCPLGLIPHFYLKEPDGSIRPDIYCFNALSGLYLISTFDDDFFDEEDYAMFQCPLGLIPHFYMLVLV